MSEEILNNEITLQGLSKRSAEDLLSDNTGHTYVDLVDEAKSLVLKTQLFKLKIAKLAIKACTIRHGGKSGQLYTLAKFANDIGVHRKRLSMWVLTYKRVVVNIENEIKTEYDWNTAQKVNDLITKESSLIKKREGSSGSRELVFVPTKSEIEKLMAKVRSNNDVLYNAQRDLERAINNLTKITAIDKFDNNMLFDISEKSDRIIVMTEKIQAMTIRLITERNIK